MTSLPPYRQESIPRLPAPPPDAQVAAETNTLKIKTKPLLTIIAVIAIITAASLLATSFSNRDGTSQQALLTSEIIILAAGGLAAFFVANITVRPSRKFTRPAMPYAKVLIVDDVPTNLDVARGILKPYGMQVDCVTSGIEAVERIRNPEITYDAVFMDHVMPEMDGIETTRIIREEIGSDYARNIPIIALTANATTGNEEMFLKNGFQAFLSKPVDVISMDTILRQWVCGKEWDQKDESFDGSLPMRNIETGQESGNADQASETDETGQEEFPGIEGINWQDGLNCFAGDRDAYLSVIRSYVDNTAHIITQICNVTEETLADYATHIHGIKGSSYGVKANKIGKQAEELEHAAKAGNFRLVSQKTPFFVENAQKLLGTLSKLLKANIAEMDEKQSQYAPDETLLDQMEEASANFNIDELEEIIKSLEYFKYETQTELVTWLREKVNKMDFLAINKRLAQRKQASLKG
ncbi:MAG: response regulator [Azoarcus sp.]|jgi:CheY-like chemotaxis protein/HPt (histidine-containing phosphotransfer) domain-containing protein|nr:response regulator [Azoarcus sp.]